MTVDGKPFEGTVTNGVGLVNLTGLSGGVKEATVLFTTTDYCNNNSTAKAKFVVNRANSTVAITQNGTDVIATVTTNATGNVTFYINGKEYNATIINGNATLRNVLNIGNNTIVAIYEGDINFTGSRNNTNFTVGRNDSLVNVTATNVTYGKASEITVEVPVAQTGYVRIIVENTGINVTVEIVDGFAKFNATGLAVGEYTVSVTYLGDNLYNVSSNITKFNITKANMTAIVTAQNITVKDNVQIVIDNVTRDFNGNVTIKVDGLADYDGIVKAVTEMGNSMVTITIMIKKLKSTSQFQELILK